MYLIIVNSLCKFGCMTSPPSGKTPVVRAEDWPVWLRMKDLKDCYSYLLFLLYCRPLTDHSSFIQIQKWLCMFLLPSEVCVLSSSWTLAPPIVIMSFSMCSVDCQSQSLAWEWFGFCKGLHITLCFAVQHQSDCMSCMTLCWFSCFHNVCSVDHASFSYTLLSATDFCWQFCIIFRFTE